MPREPSQAGALGLRLERWARAPGKQEGDQVVDDGGAVEPADRSTASGVRAHWRHAVVVGGGLAGLLCAQVLTAHTDQVTLVERDRLPEQARDRSGVPHGRHPHILLESGQEALDSVLPGFTEQLGAAGAPKVGLPGDMVQWQGRWFARLPSTQAVYTGSRAQLEQLVRERVVTAPKVRVADGTEVVGLLGDAAQVRGVVLRERGSRARSELAAELVVDASGRGSQAAGWLTGIGAEPAREERLDTGLAYASRVYRDTRGDLTPGTPGGERRTDALAYYVFPTPAHPSGGGILPMEGGRHLTILFGLRGDEPPTDEEGFLRYAATHLPHPFVHDWLVQAKPLSPVHGFRSTANIRRRYDRPGRRPTGFLVAGDALCTFNPIYGQGMTVAAKTAVALRDALAQPRNPTTSRIQRALLDASRQAWQISAGADRHMPGAIGDPAMTRTRLLQRPADWYLKRVQERYATDPVVATAFRSVLGLSAPVTSLFAPRVARAVLLRTPLPGPAAPPMRRPCQDAR